MVCIPYAQMEFPPLRQMTYALSTDGDPLRYVSAVRQIVQATGPRVPVTNVKSQAAEIEQTINQEIVFARLWSAFAFLALVIACVGLYGTMTYAVARRTNDIGIRVALGAWRAAGRGRVVGPARSLCAYRARSDDQRTGGPRSIAAGRIVSLRHEAE